MNSLNLRVWLFIGVHAGVVLGILLFTRSLP